MRWDSLEPFFASYTLFKRHYTTARSTSSSVVSLYAVMEFNKREEERITKEQIKK